LSLFRPPVESRIDEFVRHRFNIVTEGTQMIVPDGNLRAPVKRTSMACRTCAELLAAHKRAVGLYAMAQRTMRGISREEFRRTFAETDRFRRAAEDANYALLAHWRQDHNNLISRPTSS
jgi:hypothetical protein